MLYPIKTIWGKERNRAAGNNLEGENELELDYFKCDTENSIHFTNGKAVIIFVIAVGAMIGLGICQLLSTAIAQWPLDIMWIFFFCCCHIAWFQITKSF